MVGYSGSQALLYDLSSATEYNMNALIPTNSPFTQLTTANDINNNNEFIGEGLVDGVEHGFVGQISSVPEPLTSFSSASVPSACWLIVGDDGPNSPLPSARFFWRFFLRYHEEPFPPMRFFAGDFWFDESDRTFNLWGDRQGSGVSRNATRNKESGVRYSSSRHGRHPRFQDFRWNCCKTTSSTPAFLIRTLVVLTNISIGRSKFGDRHWNSGVGLLPTRIGRPVFKRRPSGQDEVWSERADFSPLGTSGPLPCVEMPVIFRAVGSVADPSPVVEWRQLAEDVKELSSPLSIACCGVAPMGKFYKDWPCVLDVVATVQPLGNSNRLSRVHVVLGLGSCSRTRVVPLPVG